MLKVIDNGSAIKKGQQRFIEKFEQFVDEKIPVQVGHRGGSYKKKVLWASKLGVWLSSSPISGSRYWNAFGIGKPEKDTNISITCEINFPLHGIDKRIGGAFAEDDSGNIYIVHRGYIRGGKKGIGKKLFEDNYRGKWIDVEDGDVMGTFALIGALNSSRFARQVSQFVCEIDRIKGLTPYPSSSLNETLSEGHEFREEFAGKRRYKIGKDIEAECDHGLVVNDLSSALQSLGFKVRNDRNRDLYVIGRDGKITSIFEIKTDTSTTSLYSAVGQLLLNSISLLKRPRLILAIPERLGKTIEGKLNKIGIEPLVFKWSDDKAIFTGLNSLSL